MPNTEQPTSQQVIADLRAALDELDARGWCKDDLVNDQGSVCAIGALGAAIDSEFLDKSHPERMNVTICNTRLLAAERQLALQLNCLDVFGAPVETFNDDYDTTYQDVRDLFTKTLADLGGLA